MRNTHAESVRLGLRTRTWRPGAGASWVRVLAGVALVLVLAGCETVEDRIARERAYFERLDPETQSIVRAGEVRLGFTENMARIALGEPNEVRIITRADGDTVLWRYQYYYPVYDGSLLVGYRFYDVHRHGARRVVRIPEYREHYRYEAEEYLRLTFRNGAIVEIERTR